MFNLNAKTKSIVFISYTAGRGGASKVMSLLQNYFAENGWMVTYIVRDIFQPYPLDNRIKIIQLGNNPKFNKFYFIQYLKKYIRDNKPYVAISFLVIPNIINIFACLGTKTKTIISERNDPKHYKILYKILILIFYRFANHIIFQTKRAMNWYPKGIKKKSTIIVNPIKIDCYASESKKNIFVSVGRLEQQKNHKLLIEAFYQFQLTHPKYQLLIYGEGDERKNLEKQVFEKGLVKKVFFPGNVLNIHKKLSEAMCFILPSNYEGLSNSLLESMAMGLPCISTKCAGSEDVIEDHINGILVSVNDEKQLLNAMYEIVENESFRKMIALKAKITGEKFFHKNILCEWNTIINRIINNG